MADNNKGYMQRYAMLFGTYMGVFWILKFILIPLGVTIPFLMLLFFCLTLCVPFLAYYYTKMYRDQICGGQIGFLHAWIFNVFMFICASLLTAAGHYIYFGFIDGGYLLNSYRAVIENFPTGQLPDAESYIQLLKTNLETLEGFTPIDITVELLVNNIYNCSLLAIIIAFIAKRRNRQGVIANK